MSDTGSSVLLATSGLRAGYGSMEILHGIDFNLDSHDRVLLLGTNGHGKTTFLRALVGATGWRAGEVSLDGRPLPPKAPHRASSRGLTLIPEGDELFPGMTVRENLLLGAYPLPIWQRRATELRAACDLFPELKERWRQPAGQLSGGERRMLSIARGLINSTRILLIDEPFLGLAPRSLKKVRDAILNISSSRTILISDEDSERWENWATRVIRMHGGMIVGEGSQGNQPEAREGVRR